MLRDDLVARMSEYDNGSVSVLIDGVLVEIDIVEADRHFGSVVIVLDPET